MKFLILALVLVSSLSAFSKEVTYKVDGADYQGYLLSKGSKAPLVILIHDWDGLTDYEVKRAESLFKLGYSVLAIDLFGKGIRPTDVKDKMAHTGELYKDRKKMRSLLKGSLDYARSKGLNVTNAVAMGYCFGGAAVLEWARSGKELKGFVSFHGGLEIPKGQSYKNSKGPLLILHGGADSMISMTQFSELADQLEAQKVDYEMIVYGGAPHAFTVFGQESYRKEADEKSWATFLSFLGQATKK